MTNESLIVMKQETAELTVPLQTLVPISFASIVSEIALLYEKYGVVLVKSMVIINLPALVISIVTIGLAIMSAQYYAVGGILLTFGGLPFALLAMVIAPAVISKILIDSFLGKDLDSWDSIDFVWKKLGIVVSAMAGSLIAVGAFNLLMILILLLMSALLAGGSMVLALAAAKFGATAVIIAKVIKVFGMVITGLVVGGVGLTTLTVNYAIIFLSPMVAVMEGKSWLSAPKRSFQVVFKSLNSALRFLGTVAAVYFAITLVSIGFLGPFMMVVGSVSQMTGLIILKQIAQELASIVSLVLISPAGSAATALLYYDHRIRYENLTIDELGKIKDN